MSEEQYLSLSLIFGGCSSIEKLGIGRSGEATRDWEEHISLRWYETRIGVEACVRAASCPTFTGATWAHRLPLSNLTYFIVEYQVMAAAIADGSSIFCACCTTAEQMHANGSGLELQSR
eukprot:scaffold100173_cov85-Cyclotella_meneghiniana.AAC.1